MVPECSPPQQPSGTPHIAIIGGGVAGATAAVHLAELGIRVTLIEKGTGLVNGPPICHLHAGGNLYRDISEAQCVELLAQSIESMRLYPHTINRRPTVIAVPHSDPGSTEQIISRLRVIQQAYAALIARDAHNAVLGLSSDYYQLYTREDLEELAAKDTPSSAAPPSPQGMDDWMIPFAKGAKLDDLQYPVVCVQEYGWSVFRLAATVSLTLERLTNCQVLASSRLVAAHYESGDALWHVTYTDADDATHVLTADYLVNACGYETGTVDDMMRFSRERMLEFKAAYLVFWPGEVAATGRGGASSMPPTAASTSGVDSPHTSASASPVIWWPEVVFHGPRGSDNGMAQLTPYADGTFQLHGMTNAVTLFDSGLVTSSPVSAQPQLPPPLADKMVNGWSQADQSSRTRRAIDHMARFIPSFSTATQLAKPLYGTQQIPGNDASLRAADVTFEDGQHYARIEVVKGSSALRAAHRLVEAWGLCPRATLDKIEEQHPVTLHWDVGAVVKRAAELAVERGYPASLAAVYGA